jgi:hypothetical protein
MLNMSLLDYEVLARQKRDAMLAEAEQLRMADKLAWAKNQGRQRGLRALLGLFRARLGGADWATVATRAA